jgi:hypothetical protein
MDARMARCRIPFGMLVLLAACGPNADDVRELRNEQKQILAKLNDLEKKLDSAVRPAAPARPAMDPNKVYDIPIARSAIRGPADARVVITEFSDFQ